MANITYDTLTYNGTEKSLAGWGFSLDSCTGEKLSQAPDTWRGTIVNTSVQTAPIFPFESVVTIQSGRISATGLANSFTGGVVKFVGARVLVPTKGDSGGPGFAYEFQGGRYFLDQCQYKQYYEGKTGTSLPAEVILFTRAPFGGTAVQITAGEQIADIVNYAIGVGLNAQLGTIDNALAVNFPFIILKPMTCSAAIDKCLELFPTITEIWDYTFMLPKVSFIQKNNLVSLTLPLFTGPVQGGASHKKINITRRDDLVARAVMLTYRITNTDNGASIIDYAWDQWGPIMELAFQNAGGMSNIAAANAAAQAKSAQTLYNTTYNNYLAAHPGQQVAADTAALAAVKAAVSAGTCDPREGIRVPSDIIDLTGYNITTATGFLDCEPALCNANPALNQTTNASSVDAPTQALRRQWWAEHRGGGVSELGSTKIRFQQNNLQPNINPMLATCIAPAHLSSGDLTGVSILNGGYNYNSGDILQLSGGVTIFGQLGGLGSYGVATIIVQDVDDDGSILSVVIGNAGYYYTPPGSPNSAIYLVTGEQGDGSGASFGLSFQNLSSLLAQYPNRIVRGTHHSWMTMNLGTQESPDYVPVVSIHVKIATEMQYAEYDVMATAGDTSPDLDYNGNQITYNNAKEHHVVVELTNGVTGTYQTLKSVSQGEAYIIGVDPILGNGIARNLYLLLNGAYGTNPTQYQHEGDYVKVEAAFNNAVTLANCLNLSGGLTEWLTMNAQITGISENYGTHITSVKIGPSKHLSAQQMSSLLNMWRIRWNWFNPAVKNDDTQTTSGSDIDLPVTSGNANTTKGTEVFGDIAYNS